jgi:phage regulator Rha-like protein
LKLNYNNSFLEVLENELFVSHRTIAESTNNKILSVQKLITDNLSELEEFGHLRFKIETVKNSVGATNEQKTYLLNEPQTTLLFTFMRNNEIVKRFKIRLVKEFYKMREILKTEQNFDLQKVRERAELLEISQKEYKIFEDIFFRLGIKREEELAITSNRAVKKETGVDFLEISEKKGLSTTEKYFTVTELCEIVRNGDFSEEAKKLVSTKNGEKPRPQNLNKLLEKEGFQFRENEIWKATEKGENFSDFVQNKSKHSEKTVFHTVWKKEILNELF